jgi:hypothetical protein
MMSKTEKFIVYAPRFRDDSGGAIVLHKLCDVLNKLGHDAKLWPLWKPLLSRHTRLGSLPTAVAYLGSRLYRGKYRTNTRYETPLASSADIEDSIVVYPEIVSGNPLGARRYVRWLLHKPGFHEGRFEYSRDDLYFSYQDAFKDLNGVMKHGGTLMVSEAFLDVYKITNRENRRKLCYMVRKGKNRADLPDLREEWVVDGYSHLELAEIFNQCKICYFYDLYTNYGVYAAACGCIPVFVPLEGISKNQWIPEKHHRVGLAYGVDEIPHAIATRDLLMENFRGVEERNTESVERFVSTVREHFSH